MRWKTKSALAGAIVVAGMVFMSRKSDSSRKASNERLLEIAKKEIETRHPEWQDELSLKPVFLDETNYWEVTFELPSATAGGTPVVDIDKMTLKVLRVYHGQ
jgi:hypothetical protein